MACPHCAETKPTRRYSRYYRPLDESEMPIFAKVDIESALEHELKSSTSHSGGGGAAAALPAATMAQSDFEAELEAAFS